MTDDRSTGYATANVTPLTPEDRERLSVLWHAAWPHREYGAAGCALCRRLERVEPERP